MPFSEIGVVIHEKTQTVFFPFAACPACGHVLRSGPSFADGEADDTGPFEVHAKAAILLDMNTDRIIYEKNLDERVYLASLTKIMTCLVALENGNLSDIVTIDEGAFTGLDGNSSTAGLQVGEQLSFNDLLYCLMLSSGNEAANAVAEHIAGSIPDLCA